MARTIGLELSTQSAKIVVLDSEDGVIYKNTINYDERFPHYGTIGGVLPSDTGERHTSPLMLVEAIEECFKQMQEDKVNLNAVDAIKLDGMQHCTVYTSSELEVALEIIPSPSSNKGLADIFSLLNVFTRKTSPIWEDRTTQGEVEELTQILEPFGGVVELTGNRAEHRFPAAQIMKWIIQDTRAYRMTSHIQLLSAFGTSILAGKIVPVDTGDGWGTNLNTLDINSPSYDPKIAKAIENHLKLSGEEDFLLDSLKKLLGEMTPYDTPVGNISGYLSEKYGVNPKAVILAGTGDNPATLLGCGGGLVLSLGSSYTLNGIQAKVSPSTGEDNVFGYIPGKSMSLICFTNGGKLHEEFLKRYILQGQEREPTAEDWAQYKEVASQGGFGKHLMLPYLLAESVPVAPAGIIRDGSFDENDPAMNIAALYFSQLAALRVHLGPIQIPGEICMVAGGGKDHVMRKLAADIFGATTFTIEDAGYAAPLGCAIAAMREVLKLPYDEVTSRFVQRIPESITIPDMMNNSRLLPSVERYKAFEKLH
jgi:xylulokinase